MIQLSTNMVSLVAAVLLIGGCEYEAPLTTEHIIPIDPELPGLWEDIKGSGHSSDNEKIMVLEYSDTEYLIHHHWGETGFYYRGYPIKIGNVKCVQLEVLGVANDPPDRDEKTLYHVCAYSITNGVLEIRLLNQDVVDNDLKTTEELRKAFLDNIGNKELFEDDPGRFGNRKREN